MAFPIMAFILVDAFPFHHHSNLNQNLWWIKIVTYLQKLIARSWQLNELAYDHAMMSLKSEFMQVKPRFPMNLKSSSFLICPNWMKITLTNLMLVMYLWLNQTSWMKHHDLDHWTIYGSVHLRKTKLFLDNDGINLRRWLVDLPANS